MVVLCKKLFFFVFFGQKYFLVCQVGSCGGFGSVREESGRTWDGNWVVFLVGGRLNRAVMGGDCTLNRRKVFN